MLVFPDNTVLINFAILRRMDLLERLLGGNGVWCLTVSRECDTGAAEPGQEDLGQAKNFLGSAILPTQAERIDTGILRAELASPGEPGWMHMGEAETIAVITSRHGSGALFVTDDEGARRLAKSNKIQSVSTWMMLKLAAKRDLIDEAVLLGYVRQLKSAGRSGAPASLRTVADVRAWVRS